MIGVKEGGEDVLCLNPRTMGVSPMLAILHIGEQPGIAEFSAGYIAGTGGTPVLRLRVERQQTRVAAGRPPPGLAAL